MKNAIASLILLTLPATTIADNLNDVFEAARINDQSYRAALAEANATQQAKGLRSAAIKPQVSAFYTYERSESDIHSETAFPVDTDNDPSTPNQTVILDNDIEPTETANNWGVAVQQTLFNASAWQQAKQGRFESTIGDIQLEVAEQNLMLRASQAYFSALTADNNLKVAKAQNKADQWLLKQTQGRYDVGEVAYTDVNQAKAAFDLSSAQLLAAEADVENARYALSILTNREHGYLAAIGNNFEAQLPEPNDRGFWRQQAAENNLNIAATKLSMQAAKSAAKGASQARLPTLTAQLAYFDNQSTTTGNSFPEFENTASGTVVSLNLNAPLYLGGSISASKRQAHANYNAALERYQLAIRSSEQNALTAFNNMTVAVSQVTAQTQAVKSAKSAADSIEVGYEAGLHTIIDLVAARRSYYAAERDLGNAKISYILRFLELKFSTGRLQKEDINNINNLLNNP